MFNEEFMQEAGFNWIMKIFALLGWTSFYHFWKG
jgi:hypothetical protein